KEDLPFILSDVLKSASQDQYVKILSFMVSVAYGLDQMSVVKLEINGEVYEQNASGSGQFDAFMRALKIIYKEKLGRRFPHLSNYTVQIPPGGRTDALVQTSITWEWDDRIYRTRGLDADQTEAAIKATIKMLNLMETELRKQ
ncbi:MAG: 2-isopropylmalate synthase, partial [Muribaculaceae bacterium]|nr:2-isopropylmalate synthase [Muribaculaceae bacterium]